MFFYLSKFVALFINPLFWIAALLIFLWFKSRSRAQKRWLLFAIILFWFYFNKGIASFFANYYQTPPVELPENKNYQYGVVLSGFINFDDDISNRYFWSNHNGDRLFHAIQLYHKGKIQKIVISGGPGDWHYPEKTEAGIVKNYLLSIGIPESDIVLELKSRNTYENAKFVKEIISNNDNILLITSAMHIKRASLCFSGQKIKHDVYSCGWLVSNSFHLEDFLIPSFQAPWIWNSLFHEIIGVVTYYIVGYI